MMPDERKHERVADRMLNVLEDFGFVFGRWRPFGLRRIAGVLREEYGVQHDPDSRMGGRDYAPGVEDREP